MNGRTVTDKNGAIISIGSSVHFELGGVEYHGTVKALNDIQTSWQHATVNVPGIGRVTVSLDILYVTEGN